MRTLTSWARRAMEHAVPVAVARSFGGGGASSAALRGSAGALAIKCSALLLGFLSSVVLTRTLGVEGFGTYSLALGWILLCAVPIQSGLVGVVVRELAGYRAAGSFALARGLLLFGNSIAVTVAVVCAGLLHIYWKATIGNDASGLTPETAMWALALLPIYCLSAMRSAALRGLGKVFAGLVPDETVRPLVQLALLVVVASVLDWQLDPGTAIRIHLGASIVGLVVGAVLLLRALPAGMKHGTAEYAVGDWLRPAAAFTLVSGFGAILQSMVVVILGSQTGSGDVGLFKAAQQLAALTGILIVAVNSASAPHIASLYRAGNRDELARLLRHAAIMMVIGTAPLSVAMIAFAAPILGMVFGESYIAAYPSLIVLAGGQLMVSSLGLVGLLLNMSGHENDTLACCLVAIAATLAAALGLVDRFGSLGAAVAVVAGQFVLSALLLWRVKVRIGISTSVFARPSNEP